MNLLCKLGIHNYKERKLSGLLCTRCRRFRNYNHFDMAKYRFFEKRYKKAINHFLYGIYQKIELVYLSVRYK